MMILANASTRRESGGDKEVRYSGTVTVRTERPTGKQFTFTTVATFGRMGLEQVVTLRALTVRHSNGGSVFFRMIDGQLSPPDLSFGRRAVAEIIIQAIEEGIEAIGKGRMYLERVMWGVICEGNSQIYSRTQSFRTTGSAEAFRQIHQTLYS